MSDIKLKFQDRTNNDTFFVGTSDAVRTREPNKGQTITVYTGFERGMTDNGQPCWSSHRPTEFKTPEEVEDISKYLGSEAWDFKVVPNTLKIYKIERKSILNHHIVQIPA